MDIDWMSYLKRSYPAIALIYPTDTDMIKINRALDKRNEGLKMIETNEYETTFYDLFVRTIPVGIGSPREQAVAKQLLSLLNESVSQLISYLSNHPTGAKQVQKQLKDLFAVNGFQYLNKVGELLSTLFIIREYSNFKIMELEFKFEEKVNGQEGKDADLLAFHSELESPCLIDILNISIDHGRIVNETGLAFFLKERIRKKIAEKKFDTGEINSRYTCFIQPFVWLHDIVTIQKYKSFFKSFNMEGVMPILCLRQLGNDSIIKYDCSLLSQVESETEV